ncbi:TSUP family transporter [Phenylobacterium sp.]|jgi:uncharacterized membrane protein YfcA|uniref:TSUP family transporter n=1 Tax=Phenylobacterium sp. TaxID=1871053 RepID=UPI003783E385
MELGPDVIAILCAVAVAAGFVDAIAGGGGLLTVPALLAAGLPPVAAIATNKVQSCCGTAAATFNFWRAGRIDFNLLRWPLLGSFLGSAIGGLLLTIADPAFLALVLPLLLVAVAAYFLFGPRASDEDIRARLTPAAFALVAAGVGFYDGFFGPGAGSFFALGLVTLMGMGLTRATAHTKALNFTSNIVSVVIFGLGGHVVWGLGLMMAVGQVAGGWLGSHTAMRFGPRVIRPLLVIVCLAMVAKLLSDPANPLRAALAARFAGA